MQYFSRTLTFVLPFANPAGHSSAIPQLSMKSSRYKSQFHFLFLMIRKVWIELFQQLFVRKINWLNNFVFYIITITFIYFQYIKINFIIFWKPIYSSACVYIRDKNSILNIYNLLKWCKSTGIMGKTTDFN